MKCQICNKETKRKKECPECEENQLWSKYYSVQKKATLGKCRNEKIRKSTLKEYLRKSIKKFEEQVALQVLPYI